LLLGPAILLIVSTADGQNGNLQFPSSTYPDVQWPVKAVVLTSEVGGGAYFAVKFTGVLFLSIEYPGIYALEAVTADDELTPLATLRPLAIGVIVESGGDRGQALALASQPMILDPRRP
jgi:hypothetical protein